MKKILYILKNYDSDCYQLNDLIWQLANPLIAFFISFLIVAICSYFSTSVVPMIFILFGIVFAFVYVLTVFVNIAVYANNGLVRYKAELVNRLQKIKNIVKDESDLLKDVKKDACIDYVCMRKINIKNDIRDITYDITDYICCSCYSDYARHNDVIEVCKIYKSISDQIYYDDMLEDLKKLETYIV